MLYKLFYDIFLAGGIVMTDYNTTGVFARIENVLENGSLTKTQTKIADYILKYPYSASIITIKQLAEETKSGQSTVVRLVDELNLEGFKDFQDRLKAELASLQKTDSAYSKNYTIMDIINTYLNKDLLTDIQKNIAAYIKNNPEKVINSTADDIAENLSISSSTLIRFVQNQLHLDGFSDFKKILSNELSQDNQDKTEEFDIELPKDNYSGKNIAKNISNLTLPSENIESWGNNYESIKKNLEKWEVFKSAAESFFEYLYAADNILIYDDNKMTEYILHRRLNTMGFVNSYCNSQKICLDNIDGIRKRSELRKSKLLQMIKEHSVSNFNSALASKLSKYSNLLIIVCSTSCDQSLIRIIKKAKGFNFDIAILKIKECQEEIVQLEGVDLKINIGDEFGGTEAVVNEMMFFELLNFQIQKMLREKGLNLV